MAWRLVDQQVADLPAGDRFQVIDDGVNVPARDERSRWLDDRPSLENEVAEVARGYLRVKLVEDSGSCQQECGAAVFLHRLIGKNPASSRSGLGLRPDRWARY
jgi:hypothetical protein